MKTRIQESLKDLFSHRYLTVMIAVLLLLAAGMVVYGALTLQPNELRVVTHYSAYGATHFYRDQWIYLISFILFAIISAALTIVLSIKLLTIKGPSEAVASVWVGVFLVLFNAIIFTRIVEFA